MLCFGWVSRPFHRVDEGVGPELARLKAMCVVRVCGEISLPVVPLLLMKMFDTEMERSASSLGRAAVEEDTEC